MMLQSLKKLIASDPLLLKHDGSINQAAAAKAFGVNAPTLHRFLSGECREPRAKFVDSVCEYFGITQSELRGEQTLPDISRRIAQSSERLSKDEELLLSLFRALKYSEQKVAFRVLAALKE
jgi:transcriptional regulator with XRE-family HTH domain